MRKLLLAVHLASSVGWVGAVVVYVALGLAQLLSQAPTDIRAAWIAMELAGWLVIVPLALAALLSGVMISLATPWGLFRHYWVLVSLGLTVFSVVILLLHMPTVSALAAAARRTDEAGLLALGNDLFHPTVGLVVLLVVLTLNVYKPRGLTRYGWRRQREERDAGR